MSKYPASKTPVPERVDMYIFPDEGGDGIRFETGRGKPPKFNPDEPRLDRERIRYSLTPKPNERVFSVPIKQVMTMVLMAGSGGLAAYIVRKAVEEIYDGKVDEAIRQPDGVAPDEAAIDAVYAAYMKQADEYEAGYKAKDAAAPEPAPEDDAPDSHDAPIPVPAAPPVCVYNPDDTGCPACVAGKRSQDCMDAAGCETNEDGETSGVPRKNYGMPCVGAAIINRDGLYAFATGAKEVHRLVSEGGKVFETDFGIFCSLSDLAQAGYGVLVSYIIGILLGEGGVEAIRIPADIATQDALITINTDGDETTARIFAKRDATTVAELLADYPFSSVGVRVLKAIPSRLLHDFVEASNEEAEAVKKVAKVFAEGMYARAVEPSTLMAEAESNG